MQLGVASPTCTHGPTATLTLMRSFILHLSFSVLPCLLLCPSLFASLSNDDMSSSTASFIPSGSTVLLTGINGLLGSRLALDLLENNYTVRGVIRAQSKAAEVKAVITQKYHARLSFVVVEDFTKADAFDDSVFEGVAAIIHAASPQDFNMKPAQFIDTTVNSTTNLLHSAASRRSIRRFIYISSLAAVHGVGQGTRPEKPFTEDDWNPITRDEAYSTDNLMVAYFASKTFAERAAWDFVGTRGQAKAKAQAQAPAFDLVTFVFAAIFGPALIKPRSLSELPSSLGYLYASMEGKGPLPSGSFVDIRDLSHAIVRALQVESAGGERFIVASGDTTIEEVQALKQARYVNKAKESYSIDASKAKRVLGFNPRSKAETLNDTKRFIDEVAAGSK